MKTIIVLAAHGAPATDYSRGKIGMLMALESMPGLVNRVGLLQRLKAALDRTVRFWPRTPANDPYRQGVDALAERIAAQTGHEVIPGYLEFCAPDIGASIDKAIGRGADRVIVATTMTTRGGEHSEVEIRDIVAAAQMRHPSAQVLYAWPFDTDRVARLFKPMKSRVSACSPELGVGSSRVRRAHHKRSCFINGAHGAPLSCRLDLRSTSTVLMPLVDTLRESTPTRCLSASPVSGGRSPD